MKALQSLTELFTQSIVDAKNLEVWAEDGRLECTQGVSIDGFEVVYTVNVNLSDVNVQPEMLMMHLVNWLNQYDVDRSNKGLDAPQFATQRLDNGHFDIKFKISIQESYSLVESDAGVWQQGDACFECVSDFTLAAIESELPPLMFVGVIDEGLCP
ncbi:phage tail protein [Shewanella sp. D64]|uniref:phage tail protein n=1 Tax=unclassified Shewanella TaxID=196818 RepID=UPI0022BA2B5C|nr:MULTISPECIES: phage tail protein [unclassified Shewanella]MEC4729002.1 phage tail protein [Shewanella sp. D64]MEC4740028.1 phage tail protein [Shewanella sp. E94]WBJ94384.1 phage tail protein [Shewanella sp. MTB7]